MNSGVFYWCEFKSRTARDWEPCYTTPAPVLQSFSTFLAETFSQITSSSNMLRNSFLKVFFTSKFVHTYGCFLSQEAC